VSLSWNSRQATLLAAYTAREDRTLSLQDFLDKKVFGGMSGSTVSPAPEDIEGIRSYMKLYKAGVAAEKAAAAV
jgi:hypothetical protein